MLSVIVPYASDHGRRAEAWNWCRQRLVSARLGIEMVEVATGAPDIVGQPGLFNRPQAYNRAHAKTDPRSEVILLHDADTTFRPEWVAEAYRLCLLGEWVLPTDYAKLTEEYSNWLLEQRYDVEIPDPLPEGATNWVGQSWSGLVMMPREAFEAVNGGDERHLGWGWDDICLGHALDTLWRPHVRLAGHALHLWHVEENESEEMFGQPHTHMQRNLMARYADARDDIAKMKALVNEPGHGPHG